MSWVLRKRVVRLPPLDLRLLEARSLAVHVMAALKIENEPALLEFVRCTLERWCNRGSGAAGSWKRAWGQVLDQPWPAIAARMTEQSERGVQLRQATPFLSVLTARERRTICAAFRAVRRQLDPASSRPS